MLLENKVAIITGAGGAIGSVVALAFAQEGAKVGVLDIDPETAHKTVEEIRHNDGQALALVADISDSTEVKRAIDEVIQQYGSLDIFINNAAFPKYAPFLELEEGAWEKVIKVSLTGYFICGQYAAKRMA